MRLLSGRASCNPPTHAIQQQLESQFRRPCRRRRSSLAQHCGCCKRRRRGFTAEFAVVSGVRGGNGRHELRTSLSYFWALSRDCEETEELLDHTQTLITAFFPPVAPASTAPVTEEDRQATLVRRASHRAVAQFWCFLQDFVEQKYSPEEWRTVAATHPFIGVLVSEGGRAGLLLNLLPPGVEWDGRDR